MSPKLTKYRRTPHPNKSKMQLVVGKIYSKGCIHCIMMSKAWEDMLGEIQKDMHLIMEEKEHNGHLKEYKKYVSEDGNKVVEVIEIESDNMEKELPYVQKMYSPEIELQGGFPTLFKVSDKKVSYYGGERTTEKMKQWYTGSTRVAGGSKTKKRRRNKTKKNKTRSYYK